MSRAEDASRVVEACLSSGVHDALLYSQNLTDAFFDLSSGQAGAILQKLRNYGVRLAVVCPPDTVQFSSRFHDAVHGSYFKVFETRDAAREWLVRVIARRQSERPGV